MKDVRVRPYSYTRRYPEEWRQVQGWPYEVSSAGSVRRSERGKRGKYGITYPGPIKPRVDGNGYLSVVLHRDGKAYQVKVHRLVISTFSEPCIEGEEINHLDGDKQNNSIENLECVTPEENILHAHRTGLFARSSHPGEMNPNAKLTALQVDTIRKELFQPSEYMDDMGHSFSTYQALAGHVRWTEHPVTVPTRNMNGLARKYRVSVSEIRYIRDGGWP